MLKIVHADCLGLSVVNSAQWVFEMCVAAQNRQKSVKPLFWRSSSSKVIEFRGNREPVYDFVLVINSNPGYISHRYWDTATYWLKLQIFPTPFHLALSFRMTPFEFMEMFYGSWN